ncbi:uncharacterized protein RHOBADRAFT_54437 [Rhodotorula graminis WP1]|uniref:Xylanolytic transcriptional activator regulatory domain-containing protein n=1 Tax=Rhodotorula graminis (strain WP1) TaxID=578459 RepID=A0A0P9F285_RHOGW|nr:uncharacterized protein RHOBADRAFT_54437 [Rhodotorula graminis WP1]KPV73843.1 hypothetical protein RHOBADRAFT_54437 [Rhodotorula graminis WP1]
MESSPDDHHDDSAGGIPKAKKYELGGDKRKPYTKAVVQAMQLRIDTLEAQLAALTAGSRPPSPDMDLDRPSKSPLELAVDSARAQPPPDRPGTSRPTVTGPTSQSFAEGSAPQVNPNPDQADTFQGGLAVNAHGELRFYGPTSSYRAVLAGSTSSLDAPETVNAIRAFSLTRAPIPTASPADPALPRRPPELAPDFKVKLLKLAFEYCFSHYSIVPERQFFADWQRYPLERTQSYSPFLLNVTLAVGCRYLGSDDDYPPEICGLLGDFDTRGDVFVTWSRYLLDQEWYNPTLSTIRGLLVLGLYLAGRGFDGPCFMFVGLALKLTEDFGLNLGPHRLSINMGMPLSDELITARRACFWSAFCSDIVSSMYIGRSIAFPPEMVDTDPPPVVAELDYDSPMYRSSAFHWASRLIFIASKVMSRVYSLKPGISLAQRQAMVPELHLLLESWHHELPSHLRASGSDPLKAPHPHILVLNMTLHLVHISLHRPFFRRRCPATSTINISTEKCLMAASNIVRLVKLLRGSAGLRFSAPGVQHAAFNAGTVLAISAVEDGISANPKRDLERRGQASKDLRFIIECLKEIGTTWTTAHTSAGVLEALTSQFEAASLPPDQLPVIADVQYSPSLSSTSASSHAPYPLFDDGATAAVLQSLDLPVFLDDQTLSSRPLRDPIPEQPPSTGVDGLVGSDDVAPGAATPTTASGYQTPSRLFGAGWLPSAATGLGGGDDDAAAFGGSSLPFLFPSWDRDDGSDDFMSLLNVPQSTPASAAQTPSAESL